jgi:1-acyl-sn-glycerol-3-phosphate acyltransferase
MICIFPEGGIKRGIEHSRFGAGYLSVRSGATAIPARIGGTPETSPVWRALFTPSYATVRFGNPYQAPRLLDKKLDRKFVSQVTAEIIAAVESLAHE